MKKIFLFLLFAFSLSFCKAQYPAFMPEFHAFNSADDIRSHVAINGAVALLRNIDTPNDSLGGFFQYNTLSVLADDNVNVFQPTGIATGRWLRMNIYQFPYVLNYSKNGSNDSTILLLNNGTRYAASDNSGSGGSPNSNIGAGYRWAVPNTNNIKTVFSAFGITIDSTTNTNALTFKVDTTTGLHTENYFNTKYSPIWTLTTTGTSGPATYTGNVLNIPQYSGTTYTASNGITLSGSDFQWRGTLNQNTTITGAGFYSRFTGGRLEPGQGAAVAAANDLTLGNDGNTFSITGATQINAITTTNWQAGSWVNLVFASTPTVKHNTAGGAGTAPILLASSADFTAAANDVLSLIYDGTSWHETSRKQAATGGQFWALPTGGTLTGVNTITSARANGLNWNGTWTATANNQFHTQFIPLITGRATVSDNIIGFDLSPTFTSGAASQVGIALNINPTWNTTGGSISTVGIKLKGDIWTSASQTYSIGQAATSFLGMYAQNFYATTYRALNGATSFAFGSSGSTVNGRLIVSGVPGLMLATHGNVPATSNGYMIQAFGEGSIRGLVLPQLATPGQPTLTTTGTTGSTSITYKIVARLTNGATTDAGPSQTIATANATLTGSNRVNISWSEVVGASFYDVYVTATTGAATLGKIGSYTADAFFSGGLQHTSNSQGDGSTPPSVNTTGNLVVGTTTTNKSTLQVNGSMSLGYVAKTGTYTATDLDHTIDCTSGTFTVTLPTAVGITGRLYKVVNSGSGTITIGTTSSQTFVNINTAPTTLTLGAVGAGAIVAYEVQSNGANWIVVGKVKNE